MSKITAIILAAGKGKRMHSDTPKVLHSLRGYPLIYYVLKELSHLKNYLDEVVVVLGYKRDIVKEAIKKYLPLFKNLKIKFTFQSPEEEGTAAAVNAAKNKIKNDKVLILCADTPLITASTLSKFIKTFLKKSLKCAVITAFVDDNKDLGVVVRDENNKICAIKEFKYFSRQIRFSQEERYSHLEVNSGIYLFEKKLLFANLPKIKIDKKTKEKFFTDIVAILYSQEISIEAYVLDNPKEIKGVNTFYDLLSADRIIRRRIINRLIERGVKIIDEESVFIDEGVKIGKNTLVYPFTFIEKDVVVGKNCSLGPFLKLREGSRISDNTSLGSFLEITRSYLGKGVKAKHFGYLGDAVVGDNVNIGAGVVVANYDGKNKYPTIIENEAFIGSDSILVAPLRVGKKAKTGAGSVVTKDVKQSSVVVGVPAKELRQSKRNLASS